MANAKKLLAIKKKKKAGKKLTKAEKELMIAYTPLSEAEKARQRADLIRKLKSGEHTAGYRWHGGRSNVSDRH
jgi:hypothetical protein